MPIASLWTAILVVIAGGLIRFFTLLHKQRKMLNGLPQGPRNYLMGNAMGMASITEKSPTDAAPQTMMPLYKEHYNLPDYFYFDPWPFADPMLVVCDVDLLDQMVIEHSMPKHKVEHDFMKAFGGPSNILVTEGAEWKKWRSLFNPGFSHRYLMGELLPIIEECRIFLDIMKDYASKNSVFRMESATTKLTIDIIGKIVLGIDLDAQRSQNDLVDAFVSQTRWQYIGAQFQPSELIDIRRPMMIAYNNWRMDRYIGRELESRFAASRLKSKKTIDLALDGYLKDQQSQTSQKLDPTFKAAAISNMKTFIFAGHDTTSGTICYALYYLEKNPSILAKLRAEQDTILGSGDIGEALLSDPYLLDKLPYTTAVLKEVLRLQPPANTSRFSQPSQTLRDPSTGAPIPSEGFMLFPPTIALHRNPKYFPDPNTFDPDRFIPGSPVYDQNNRNAWIPFLKGPRNCIGQDLAMIEMKVVIAMVLREFDFEARFDEVGRLEGDGSGYTGSKNGIVEQFGERAYQVARGTAKPAEGMPCRMRLRT